MKKYIAFCFFTIVILVSVSCGEKPSETPAPPEQPLMDTSADETSIPSEAETNTAEGSLPFILLIDGVGMGQDNSFHVSEGSVVSIGYRGASDADCMILINSPDGLKTVLGSWNSANASFIYQFQYGENIIEIHYNDEIHEFLVVSGAPSDDNNGLPCTSAFIEINRDAKWIFDQTGDLEAPATWTQTISNLSTAPDGNLAFTLLLEQSTGIEEHVTHTTSLNLKCTENTIYITDVLETKDDVVWTTVYDPGSVYMPSRLADGVTWERHGIMKTSTDDIEYTTSIIEAQRCTGIETISISSGEFDAYQVEYSLEIVSEEDDFTIEGTAWYVPGLGRILNIGNIEGNPKMELVSYDNVAPRINRAD